LCSQQAILKPVSGQSGKFVELLELADFESWPLGEMPTSRGRPQAYQEDVKVLGETLLFFFNGHCAYAVQRLTQPHEGASRVQVEVSDEVISQAESL
jgi:hypothetical protein